MTLVAAIVLVAVALVALSIAPAPADAKSEKISPRVASQIDRTGRATFWVQLEDQADLSGASLIDDWSERGRFVHDRLRAHARRSQAPIRAQLRRSGSRFRSFWIANAMQVTGGAQLVEALAARPDVARIAADREVPLPDPEPALAAPRIQAVEWNVDRIGAPQVWDTLGVRGEGIVVANIDTGVQFDHPALRTQYAGNPAGGTDHDYHWFNAVGGCPTAAPCDDQNHGTHTMGTMVGDDGGVNQVGAAPRSRWIAARGCSGALGGCPQEALLAAGQWMLAPTNLAGQSPRPDLRPHVINNSWGGASNQVFRSMVQSWVAAGIFPVFAAGNSGPACGTAGSPGDYPESYGVGAHDTAGAIAQFSSRGSTSLPEAKPNIAAPGVNVRSSIAGGGYGTLSGTSMSAPHVAAAVALAWSADPGLVGDVASTRSLLDATAADVADTSCGGTAADNGVWGEGRLDVSRAVASASSPAGIVEGRVTDAGDATAPIAGATVRLRNAQGHRTVTTDAAGRWRLRIPAGTYELEVTAFGYVSGSAPGVTVAERTTTVHDIALTARAAHTVSGTVRDTSGVALAGVRLAFAGTPLAQTATDASGRYSFARVPVGTYRLELDGGGRCLSPLVRQVVVDADEALDLDVPRRTDQYGHSCTIEPASFIRAANDLAVPGQNNYKDVTLPFPFEFYGKSQTQIRVSTNGHASFGNQLNYAGAHGSIPFTGNVNHAIFAFNDGNINIDAQAGIRTETLGAAPNRRFVIEWRNVALLVGAGTPSPGRVSFEIVLSEGSNDILVQYADIGTAAKARGAGATIGLENDTGTDGFQFSNQEASISDGMAIRYRERGGTIAGVVRNASGPVAGAKVSITGAVSREVTADASGRYSVYTRAGAYRVTASAFGHTDAGADVTVTENGTTQQDIVLPALATHAISGRVLDSTGGAVAGASVRVAGTPLPRVRTDAQGAYRVAQVPAGSHDVVVQAGCLTGETRRIAVDGDNAADFTLAPATDASGYVCRTEPAAAFTDATTVLALTGDDVQSARITLPFSFRFYGLGYTVAHVSENGYLSFEGASSSGRNTSLLTGLAPPAGVYAFWDDLVADAASSIRTRSVGTSPNRRFVVEWRNVHLKGDAAKRIRFEVTLFEGSGQILTQYADLADDPRERGESATVGIENVDGTQGIEHSYEAPLLTNEQAIRFRVGECTLLGTNAAETMTGTTGADHMCSLAGNDTVRGGAGNDTLVGGAGADTLNGEAGDDVIRARDGTADNVTCGAGADTVEADANDTVAADCEVVARPGAAAALGSMSLSPASVTGGSGSTATVSLTAPAPSGGAVVTLASSSPSVTVPADVPIAAGQSTATFPIATTTVSASTPVSVSGTWLGVTRSATLTVTPAGSAPPPPAPPAALAAPTLTSPANNGRVDVDTSVTFDWSDVANAASYTLQVSSSTAFTSTVLERTITASQAGASLTASGNRFWRVRANDASGAPGAWSAVRTFEVRD